MNDPANHTPAAFHARVLGHLLKVSDESDGQTDAELQNFQNWQSIPVGRRLVRDYLETVEKFAFKYIAREPHRVSQEFQDQFIPKDLQSIYRNIGEKFSDFMPGSRIEDTNYDKELMLHCCDLMHDSALKFPINRHDPGFSSEHLKRKDGRENLDNLESINHSLGRLGIKTMKVDQFTDMADRIYHMRKAQLDYLLGRPVNSLQQQNALDVAAALRFQSRSAKQIAMDKGEPSPAIWPALGPAADNDAKRVNKIWGDWANRAKNSALRYITLEPQNVLSEDRSRLIDKEFEPTFSEIGQTLSRLTLPGNAGNRARELIVDAFDIAKWAGYGAMERFDIHFDVVKERLEQATTKIALEPEKLKEINDEVARLSTLPTDGPPDQPGQIPAGAGIKPISVKDAQQLMHSIVRIRSVLGEFVRNRDITGRIPAELLHDGDTSDSEPPIKRRRTRENQKNRTSPATDCVEPTGANSGGNDVGDDGLDQRPRSREGTSRG